VDVLPDLAAKLASPQNFPRFEFIRLVTGLPIEGFYPFPVPPGHPGYPQFNWLFAGLQFATEVRADVERKAGGAVGQNLDHAYALTDAQGSYLASLRAGCHAKPMVE
jgi:hypothetical protein